MVYGPPTYEDWKKEQQSPGNIHGPVHKDDPDYEEYEQRYIQGGGSSGGGGGGQPQERPVQGPETYEEYMEHEAPGPRTEEGKYFTGVGNPFEPGVGKYYTQTAYEQFWRERYQKSTDFLRSIDDKGFYVYEGKEIYGHSLKQIIKKELVDPSYERMMDAKTIGDDVDIFRGRSGFEFREKEMDGSPSLSGFGSYVLHIGDYTWEGIKREPWKPGDPIESKGMKESRLLSHHRDIQAWRERDIGYFAAAISSNPYTIALGTQALGGVFGFLKGTTWGGKTVFQVGLFEKSIGSAPNWTYKYTFDVTRAGLLQSGIYAYPTYEAAKQVYKSPYESLKTMAVTLPISMYFYTRGYKWGYGLAQRRGGLVGLKGLDRTRQMGIYESTDAVYRSKLNYKDLAQQNYFDLSSVKHMYRDKLLDVGLHLKHSRFPTRLGGSVAAKIHMGSSFRTGDIPSSLSKWAWQRQISSGTIRPLIGQTGPVDIDLWLFSDLGRKGLMASGLPKVHVVDVPLGGYRPGRYYGYGWSELGSVKGKIVDPYLSNLKINVSDDIFNMGAWGMSSKGRIDVSSRLVVPGKQVGYPQFKHVSLGWMDKPSYLPSVSKIHLSGTKTVLHEFYHHKYPRVITKNMMLHELKVEALEVIGAKPYERTAILNWFKTGKWVYRQPITVKTPKLQELFMRKSVSILPSHSTYTAYRSYKDIPDWFEMGRFVYERTRDPKLYLGMAKVTNPELFTPPKVTFAERIVGRLGGPVKPTGVYDMGSSVYLRYPHGYGYPSGLLPSGYHYGKKTRYHRSQPLPVKYPIPSGPIPHRVQTIKESKPVIPADYTMGVPPIRKPVPTYKTPRKTVLPPPVVPSRPIGQSYKQKKISIIPPLSPPFYDGTPKRHRGRRPRFPMGLGYKFRLFESKKYEYKSPFKNI